jgi:hypothetical protein
MLSENNSDQFLCSWLYGVLFNMARLRMIKMTPLDNGYVVIEAASA